MMTVRMDRSSALSSRELVQRLLKKNIELENGLRRSAQSKVPSDPNAWLQMRENYETIILEDHEFSENHDVQYLLWVLHYRRIEEFRQHINAAASAGTNASSGGKILVRPDKVKKLRSVFKSFLMEATGFYHDLILKIRAKYGLPLSYFNEGTENEIVLTKDESKLAEMKKGLASCHRCLIYLGDLARYKGLYGEVDSVSCDYAAASSYYMQAASLCPASGNPHHQLAILASYSGDELLAVYRYFRSLAVEVPFSTARDNLVVAFEKNRQSYSQLPCNTTMTSRRLPARSAGRGRGRGDAKLLAKDTKVESNHQEKELTGLEMFKAFSIRFVRLQGILFTRTSLETFEEVFSSLIIDLKALLSSGSEEEFKFGLDDAENAVVSLRLVAILIFTVHNVKKESENQSYAEILQRTVLLQNAFTAAFEFTGYILKRCIELHDTASSSLLPSVLVFIEWLACHQDVAAGTDMGEKQIGARTFFWEQCVSFMNKLILTGLVSVYSEGDEACFFDMSRYDEGETGNRLALWEDFELRGFLPLAPAHIILDFSRKHAYGNDGGKGKISRVQRILAAGRVLANIVSVDQQRIYLDPSLKKFVMGREPPIFAGKTDSTFSSALDTTLTKVGSQIENVADFVNTPSTSNLGLAQTKASKIQTYIEGEEEEEEIVFKPTVPDKYTDVTAPMLTAFDLISPVQVSSVGDWTTHGPHLSAPFEGVQMAAVSNSSSKPHPSTNTIPQHHLQYPNSDTSRWSMQQEALIYDGLRNMNINGNGYNNKQILQEGSSNLHPSSFVPVFSSPANLNANSTLSSQIKASEMVYPSPFGTLVPSGPASDGMALKFSAALPTRKNPVSRPVRHLGPPPGFTHVSSKEQDDATSNYFAKEQQLDIDDYSWLDGYQSSSSKGMGTVSSIGLTHNHLNANMSSTPAFANISSFPFPGKQVSNAQTRTIDGQKWLDFQLFEQPKAHGQKLERSSPPHALLPERHQS